MESVDTSISDLVTIIVKAPNQQIADQTIQCKLDWTIKNLKDYLSRVYPCKPKTEEQKLIYSGKLLTDTAVLKDVLRTYEGQENHTVHLVCTSKVQKLNKMSYSATSSNTVRNNTSIGTPSPDSHRNVSTPHVSENTVTNSSSLPIGRPHVQFIDQMNTNNFASSNFNARYFWPASTAFVNVNDVHANQQFAYLQQVYAQYMSQYMQMMGQPGFGYLTSHVPQTISRTSQFSTIPNANTVPQDRNNAEANQIRDNQPAAVVAGNDVDEEDGRNNRDWLDWFYVCSRIIILFSVVYFYSTPLRLLAVLLLVCMFYLHQNMRLQNEHLNLNNNNNNNNAINHNNQNNENRQVLDDAEVIGLRHRRPQQEGPDADEAADSVATPRPVDQSSTPGGSVATPTRERPSPIAVTLLAIRTFFLSLVPDQPVL